MKRRPSDKRQAGDLRRVAEQRLVDRPLDEQGESDADSRRLVHELQVHQIELELQNEELRNARGELEAVLGRYTEIFDFAPIGYFTVGADGTIREVNLAGARLVGVERRRLVGRRFAELVANGSREPWTAFIARVLTMSGDDAGSESCELPLERQGGALIEARITASHLAGAAPTALVAIEDVSRRKRAETELLEEARNKDAFLAMLSHELRNPLAPIRNSLFVLARAAAGTEPAVRAHAVIDRQVAHLTRIIDDLLDVTRIARGKVRLQRERLELGDLVRRALDDHRQGFEAAGVALEARFGSELFWVDADATRIAQIIGNLLGNAAKFTSRGDKVEVFMRRDGQRVALSVHDTGMGIAPELLGHVFEAFSQAPQSLDRTRGGLGLGLAMVKGLVELHGGTVTVASDGLGRGAKFVIRLPLAPAAARSPEPAVQRRVEPYRVLIIEDNVDAADTLKDALELEGHVVRVAYNGPDGIAVARAFRPQVVVCDIGLPGMDGYEVARAFRSEDGLKSACLVALSGYAQPEDLRHAVEAGFDRHVAKPPTLESLEQVFADVASSVPGASATRA